MEFDIFLAGIVTGQITLAIILVTIHVIRRMKWIPVEFKLKAWHVMNGFIAPADMEIENINKISWKLKRDGEWWPFLIGDIIVQTPDGQFYSLPYNGPNK